MSGPEHIFCEEPIRPNSRIIAVDEKLKQLVVADFAVDNAFRYSIMWKRGDKRFKEESIGVLEKLATTLLQPARLVVGWKHDVRGWTRTRHLHLISFLKKSGWGVHAEEEVGIATRQISTSSVCDLLKSIEDRDVGWFIAFGDWGSTDRLVENPFLGTIRFFCWNHHIAPSFEFINGVQERGGALAFRFDGGDRDPGICLITSERWSKR